MITLKKKVVQWLLWLASTVIKRSNISPFTIAKYVKRILEELDELINEIQESYEDGKITKEEMANIIDKLRELVLAVL